MLVRTDAETRDYITENYLPNASADQIDKLLQLYPQDPADGSPYDTGFNNTLTPQYKRLASLQGDFYFQAPRRFLLQQRSANQNAWSYCECYSITTNIFARLKGTISLVNEKGKDVIPELGSVSPVLYLIYI